MPTKKHKIVLDFDPKTLLDLRKVLFEKGLSVQMFFTTVASLVSMRDSRFETIYEEAIENKINNTLNTDSKVDAESLYHLIQAELRKSKQMEWNDGNCENSKKNSEESSDQQQEE
jgi:hypothetical protein